MAACVGALAVREVALCVTGGHFFADAVTLYCMARKKGIGLGVIKVGMESRRHEEVFTGR